MSCAVYARKSTEQHGVGDDAQVGHTSTIASKTRQTRDSVTGRAGRQTSVTRRDRLKENAQDSPKRRQAESGRTSAQNSARAQPALARSYGAAARREECSSPYRQARHARDESLEVKGEGSLPTAPRHVHSIG